MNSINYGELEKAIGRVTIYFSSLENTISRLIALLIGEQGTEIGVAITSELPFKQLVGMLQNIFRYKSNNADKITKLDKLLKSAFAISNERNKLIHSVWAMIPNRDDEYIRFKNNAKYKKNSNGIQRQSELLNPLEIYKLADKIHQIEGEIYQFEIDRSII